MLTGAEAEKCLAALRDEAPTRTASLESIILKDERLKVN